MAEIGLRNGEVCLVDQVDFETYGDRVWTLNAVNRKHRYVQQRGTGGVLLHRLITGARPGQIVDPINGDTLDNRRSNLRICKHSENMRNRVGWRPKFGFKGVNRRGDRYYPTILVDGVSHALGGYETEHEAAFVYDGAAERLHGEFARLNFNPGRDWLFPYATADVSGRRRAA